MKKDNLRHAIASHETAPLAIKTKSGLSAEGVAVLRSKTQKPVSRRQPSSAVSVYDCSSLANARFLPFLSNIGLALFGYVRSTARLVGGGAI